MSEEDVQYKKVFVVWGTDYSTHFSTGKAFEDEEEAKEYEEMLNKSISPYIDGGELQELEYVPRRKNEKKEWEKLMIELDTLTDIYVKLVDQCKEKIREMEKEKTLKHNHLKEFWKITGKAKSSRGNMRDPRYPLTKMYSDKSEDEELSEKYDSRIDLTDKEWIELKEGESIIDHYNKNKRSNRNIEVNVTDDISHTNLSEEEYKIVEEDLEKQELSHITDEELVERTKLPKDQWIKFETPEDIIKMVEKKEIEKAIENARYSLEMDGYLVRKNHEELVRNKLRGEISEEEFLKQAKEIALREYEKSKIVIDDPNLIPKNMTEKEEHEFWSNHTMSERFLEESIIEDDDLPPPRRGKMSDINKELDRLKKRNNILSQIEELRKNKYNLSKDEIDLLFQLIDRLEESIVSFKLQYERKGNENEVE